MILYDINKLKFDITTNHIRDMYGGYIMHICENHIMKEHINHLNIENCDVLEIGFGMGISANYIQERNPKSHTIMECHPQVLEKLKKWSIGKENIKIIDGKWKENIQKLNKYNSIFFDTHMDRDDKYFFNNYKKWLKINGKMTFFNPINYNRLEEHFKNVDNLEIVEVDSNIDFKDYSFEDVYKIPILTNF